MWKSSDIFTTTSWWPKHYQTFFQEITNFWTLIFYANFGHFSSLIYLPPPKMRWYPLRNEKLNVDFKKDFGLAPQENLKYINFWKVVKPEIFLVFPTLDKCHINSKHQISFKFLKGTQWCMVFPTILIWLACNKIPCCHGEVFQVQRFPNGDIFGVSGWIQKKLDNPQWKF